MMKTTTEELEEYQASQEKICLVQKEVADRIVEELRTQDEVGKMPQIIFDTFVQKVAEDNHIQPREAFLAIQKAVENHVGFLTMDGTTIRYRYSLRKCPQCNARYSELLKSCPGCKSSV